MMTRGMNIFEIADLLTTGDGQPITLDITLIPGHTLALGGETPSPVVDIRVAGQLLAQGRLVDVGGMPGVQITRMHAAGQDGGTPQGAGDGTGRD